MQHSKVNAGENLTILVRCTVWVGGRLNNSPYGASNEGKVVSFPFEGIWVSQLGLFLNRDQSGEKGS